MALKFFWTCESTTLGASDYTAGADTTATAVGTAPAPTIASGAALVGTYGVDIPAGSRRFTFDSDDAIFSASQGAWGCLFRKSSHSDYATILSARPAGDNYGTFRLWFNDIDQLMFTHGHPDTTTDVATATTTIANATTYGVVCRWNQATDTLRIEVYTDPLGTPTLASGVSYTSWTYSSAWGDEADGFQIGEAGVAGFIGYIDQVFVDDAYDAPIQNKFGITSYTQYASSASPARFAPYANQVISL
jgi:hypothetical protein